MTGRRELRRALHAEWTKLATLTSTGWLLVAVVVATAGVSAAVTAGVDTSACPTPATCFEDTTELSLTGVQAGQVAVVALAALAVTAEYGTRTIDATLAAVPRRGVVLAAKAGVVAAAVAVAGALGVSGSLLAGRFILPANGFTAAHGYPALSPAHGPTLRAAVGTVLYLGLVALLSLGIGTVVRDTAIAVTGVLGLLFVVPLLVQLVGDPTWQERLQRWTPASAGLSIQATRDLDRLAVQPWPGLGILVAYTGTALVAGAVRLNR